MGYPNDSLGATPSISTVARALAAKAAAKTAPAPVKIQVAPAPITSPLVAFLQPRTAPIPVISPVPVPRPTPLPLAPTPTGTPPAGSAQAAAPIIAAAATPIVGPIAAAIPPIVDAATEPSPTRIRILRPSAVAPDLTPSASGGGPELYAQDGKPLNEAAVSATTAPKSLADTLKSLPPAALASIAVGVLFLLSHSSKRR